MSDRGFDFLNSIMETKVYMMNEKSDEKDYVPFFVNRGLSQHVDCLMATNEMNMVGHIDPKMQYDYLFHTIRKFRRKRGKWAKAKNNDLIRALSEYYNVNKKRAEEWSRLMDQEQQDTFMKMFKLKEGVK